MIRRERLQAELVAPEEHLQDDLARIGDGPDGVHARELVDVASQPVRGLGIALGEEELELGGDDGNEPALGVRIDDALEESPRAGREVVGSVERPRLTEAPGDLRLPGHGAERVEVGPDREVDVPLLAADDRRVPEVGSHHRGAERDALLAHAGEVPDRNVLAAGNAVQVRVEQPDGAHAQAAHCPRGRLGLLVQAQLDASFAWTVVRSAPARAGA